MPQEDPLCQQTRHLILSTLHQLRPDLVLHDNSYPLLRRYAAGLCRTHGTLEQVVLAYCQSAILGLTQEPGVSSFRRSK